jgi:hypothetical protein
MIGLKEKAWMGNHSFVICVVLPIEIINNEKIVNNITVLNNGKKVNNSKDYRI